jgi:predicted CoA-binding protein
MNIELTTLVIGASDNPERYSFLAIQSLRKHDIPVKAIGRAACTIVDVVVDTEPIAYTNIDTVTLYVSPVHQKGYYDYILSLHPRRIIFNPGTENAEFKTLAEAQGIQTMEACTLVMLSVGSW